MRVITHSISYPSRSDVIRVTPLGDLHLGNALCDEKLLAETVAEIEADPLHYWGGMGDYGDFIKRGDRRHRESHLARWMHGKDDLSAAQVDRIVKVLDPIKDKCLWLVRGNHEDLIHKRYEHDVYAELCRRLGACAERPLELGYRGFVRLRMNRRREKHGCYSVVFYVHHGHGGGRLAGSWALKVERLPKAYDADVYLYAHGHRKLTHGSQRLSAASRADRVVAKDLWQCTTGCFLQSFDKKGEREVYSEEKDYAPLGTGTIEVQIRPDKKTIKVLS